MPLELKDLQKQVVKITVTIDGHSLAVEYKPHMVTPQYQAQWLELTDRDTPKLLVPVLESWDLTKNGKPVPLTEAALAEVPMKVLFAIMRAISEDMYRPPSPPVSSGSFS